MNTATERRAAMAAPSWTRNGGLVDLANPRPEDVDFAAIAGSLSKLARWAGRHDGPAFSVAQHCVMGADAIAAETGDRFAAGAFLLHDAHEGNGIGDIVTPAVRALEATAAELLGPEQGHSAVIGTAISLLKARHDIAIWRAAGIDWRAMPRDTAAAVKAMDKRMGEAEAHFLFGPAACPRPDPYPKFTGSLKPWGPARAEEAWLQRLDLYLGVRP
ncbi:hypothetical protein [Oricola thermophila]|uniref:HD domain-containing protein n=1 Tax=Oricola thermophila TaxID=2742145 RepID=A0A6N1VID7_9HYPH|nr:hypothetical protein [Oricola thermophila]QKV18747.1 hypothetical protein HTY61_09940 [Oricola thermophila]